MSTRLPWFRMYTDFLNDPKLIALAFEDQRHFIGVLALKSDGALDDIAEEALLNRIVAQRLWIDHGVISDVKRRLMNAGLIDSQWQPMAWAKRQMRSDADSTAAERQRRQRERNKSQAEDSHALRHAPSHATVTRLDTDTDKEVDKKNTSAIATPSGVCNSVWTDFLQLRKTKKAKLTQTALDGIQAEADKAGWTLENALRECCARGWVGFKAEWVATTAKQKPQTYTERMVSAVGELTGKNTIESEAANVFAISRS